MIGFRYINGSGVMLLLIWLGGAWPARVLGQTEICGEIPFSSNWIPEKSPYIVTNDVLIPARTRVRVEPGVVIRFRKPGPCKDIFIQDDWADSAYSTIKVDGALYLTGTPDKPIIFENEGEDNSHTGWDGIRISGKTHLLVEMMNVIFRGANQALQVKNSTFRVSNCLFEKNNVGINMDNVANLMVVNNNFISNRSAGIMYSGSNPSLRNNIFAFNQNYGIWGDSRLNIDIGYNAFWENFEGHCYKCERGILVMQTKNARGDSTDHRKNFLADPVFRNSKSYEKYREKDLSVPTKLEKVKNKMMARKEWDAQKKMKRETKPPFQYQGTGPYVLSEYSPLLNAGYPDKDYNDCDGSPNDIGYHGGPHFPSSFEGGIVGRP